MLAIFKVEVEEQKWKIHMHRRMSDPESVLAAEVDRLEARRKHQETMVRRFAQTIAKSIPWIPANDVFSRIQRIVRMQEGRFGRRASSETASQVMDKLNIVRKQTSA